MRYLVSFKPFYIVPMISYNLQLKKESWNTRANFKRVASAIVIQYYGLTVTINDINKWRVDHKVTSTSLDDMKVATEVIKERVEALIGNENERTLAFVYPGIVSLIFSFKIWCLAI